MTDGLKNLPTSLEAHSQHYDPERVIKSLQSKLQIAKEALESCWVDGDDSGYDKELVTEALSQIGEV